MSLRILSINSELTSQGFAWERKPGPVSDWIVPTKPPSRRRGKRDPAYSRAYRKAQQAKWRAMGIIA